MNKSFLVVILVSLGLIGGLYSLPKIIVGNQKKPALGVANRDTRPKTEDLENNEPENEASHSNKLSQQQTNEIYDLRLAYLNSSSGTKLKAGQQLIKQFSNFQLYDSAAFYSEKLAQMQPNEANWISTGDFYYQAFTFAVNDVKASKMGEKSREYYKKALDKNPNLLLAKTNMAMTYVATPTPMQGILLLREVVAQSPDFEPALFNLGMLSMRSNQFSKAVERFKHITNNNPNNTKAAFYLGVSLARLGRNEEAKEILLIVKSKDKDPVIQAELDKILNELNN